MYLLKIFGYLMLNNYVNIVSVLAYNINKLLRYKLYIVPIIT